MGGGGGEAVFRVKNLQPVDRAGLRPGIRCIRKGPAD